MVSDWTEARARLAEAAADLNAGGHPSIGRWVAQAALERVAELERHPCAQHEATVQLAAERIKALEGEVARIAGQRDALGEALRRIDEQMWGEFCGCCGVVMSLESQDEECGPLHTAVQLSHAALATEVPAPPKEGT